jgi:hypothetical protein
VHAKNPQEIEELHDGLAGTFICGREEVALPYFSKRSIQHDLPRSDSREFVLHMRHRSFLEEELASRRIGVGQGQPLSFSLSFSLFFALSFSLSL